MDILEYIEELMDQGMTEEDAYRCANVVINDNWYGNIPDYEDNSRYVW